MSSHFTSVIKEISSRKWRAKAGSFCLPALWICLLPEDSPKQPGEKTQSSLEGRRNSRCRLSWDLNSSAFHVAEIAGVLWLSGPESCSWLGDRGELGLRLSVKENSCHSSQLFFLNIEFDTSHRLAASERLDRVESRAQISAWRWLCYLTALLIFLRRLAAFSHIF